MTFSKGFYITRTKGMWEVVTPFRRRFAFNLEEAIKLLYGE